jgi:predicted  nucleic acid-binding Zn-ribbon protein
MPWPEALLRLQEIDLEFQTINQRLTEIENTLRDQSIVTNAEQHAEATSQVAREAKRTQTNLEFELNQVQSKLRNTEHKLYSGRVTNARELQDLQAESKALKRRVATLEDELLEAMLESESATADAEAAQAQLEDAKNAEEHKVRQLSDERTQLREHGQAMLKETEGLKAQIPAVILESYRYLKSRTGGIPVAKLSGSVCSRCGVEVLKPTERKVNNGEEAYCDGCKRILVS